MQVERLYNSMLFLSSEKNRGRPLCDPMVRWYYSELGLFGSVATTHEHLQQLVTIRNTDTRSRLYGDQIDEFINACVTLLRRCVFLREYKLFVVRQQEPTPSGNKGWISILMGDNRFGDYCQFIGKGMRLMTGGVYILNSSQDRILHLSPWLVGRRIPMFQEDTVFVGVSLKKGIPLQVCPFE